MRKVTLAAPASWIEYLDAGEVDETIEVEDFVASRLLGDGYAREPATAAAKSKADKQEGS